MASGYDGELSILMTMQGQRVPKPRVTSRYKNSLVLQRGPVMNQFLWLIYTRLYVQIDTDLDTDLLDQIQANSPPAPRAEP